MNSPTRTNSPTIKMANNNLSANLSLNDLDISKFDESTNTESSIFVQREKNDISEIENFDQIDLKVEKEKIFNNTTQGKNPNAFFRRVGNLNLFLPDKDNLPWIVIGPHWPFFICLTTSIFVIFGSFFYLLSENLNPAIKIIGIFIYFCKVKRSC